MVARRLASRGHIPYVPHAATQPFDIEFGEDKDWYRRHSFSIIDRWANALFLIKPKTKESMAWVEQVRAEQKGIQIFNRLADVPTLVPPKDYKRDSLSDDLLPDTDRETGEVPSMVWSG